RGFGAARERQVRTRERGSALHTRNGACLIIETAMCTLHGWGAKWRNDPLLTTVERRRGQIKCGVLSACRNRRQQPRCRASGQLLGPSSGRLGQLGQNRGVGFSRALEYVESVVGRLDDVKFAVTAKTVHDGLKKFEIGKRVASPLQEEHRHRNFGQMVSALG